jgi:muramoyltetrapeptide carboxypeptidase
MKIPASLKKGATIGITCPAGYMPYEKAQTCIDTLQAWGYRVVVGNLLGSTSNNYFSGTDDERCFELQKMLDSPEIDAILFGRGGYGMSRIIDQLNFKQFKKNPKWIIGYSDITVLHMHLFANYKIASLHAPMAAAFNDGQANNIYIQSLRRAIKGKKASYECEPHPMNKRGSATGRLVGGNLSLLANVIGTASDYKTKDCILFIEDIGEYLYSMDRYLVQLKRSGKFNKIAGLIFGGFTEMKDTERPYGKTMDEILQDISADLEVPVCFHFPVSHEKENVALKIGVPYSLLVGIKRVILHEI